MRVRDEHRSASARVSNDRRITVPKRIDISSRQNSCTVEVASVRVQRATTHLINRCLHDAAIRLQHPPGRFVHPPKQTFGDARLEEKYGRSARLRRTARRDPIATAPGSVTDRSVK